MSKDFVMDVSMIQVDKPSELKNINSFFEFRSVSELFGKKVTKFYVFTTLFDDQYYSSADRATALFFFEDGSKRCFPLCRNEELIKNIYFKWSMSASRFQLTTQEPRDWRWGLDSVYTSEVKRLYESLHSRIEKGISKDQKELAILDLGCGDGKLLKNLEKEKCYQLIGIDSSKENIRKAKENYEGSCRFIEDDVFNFKDVIESYPLQNKPLVCRCLRSNYYMGFKKSFSGRYTLTAIGGAS